jgi:hypothetical protein
MSAPAAPRRDDPWPGARASGILHRNIAAGRGLWAILL